MDENAPDHGSVVGSVAVPPADCSSAGLVDSQAAVRIWEAARSPERYAP